MNRFPSLASWGFPGGFLGVSWVFPLLYINLKSLNVDTVMPKKISLLKTS